MALFDMHEYNDAAESSKSNSTAVMTAGAYVLRIQKVNTEWETRDGIQHAEDRKCVQVVYDVAEGDCAGRYSEDDYYADESRDWMHATYISWKNLGYLKRLCGILDRANPGFDAASAINAEKWTLLIGKKFGGVIDGTVDTNDRGYDRWKLRFGDWCDVEDVLAGNTREPRVDDLRDDILGNVKSDTSSVYDDDEIPF